MMVTRRHLLVIAPQCPAKGQLDQLEKAAHALHRILADEAIGDCQPGLRDDRSLLYGALDGRDIEEMVREAIEYANEKDATLVLALLGHGDTPGDAGPLYLMGHDAQEGGRNGVEVSRLIRDAADDLGVNGVIAIVDTCFAVNALPRFDELTRGLRGGRFRLALLMASSATERAFDLRFSRELAEVLSAGLGDAGPMLRVTEVFDELRPRVTGQTINKLDYDADPLADSPLWLARNVRHDDSQPGDLIGARGRRELGSARHALDPQSYPAGASWDAPALQALQHELSRHSGPDQWRNARRAVQNARIAQETVKFLRSRIGQELGATRLRRALVALWAEEGWLSPVPPRPTEVEAVDHVAFGHPDSHRDCREWMSKFVWLLVSAAGVENADNELWRWARAVDARQQLTDAIEAVTEMREREQLRLVILLPSLAGDWPESLEAWLYGDENLRARESFRCATVGRLGTEEGLREVLNWAHTIAEQLGPELKRVDIVVPSALLLTWHPEMVRIGPGLGYLGVTHDVLTHWSERFRPPTPYIRRAAAARLRKITSCASGAPLDWIAEPHSREHSTLRDDLDRGQYMQAVGLEQHPGSDTALMDLLLQYIPILLWPQAEASFTAERHGYLDLHWGLLPEGLLMAYRKRWRQEDAGDLADLRAVWDDQQWLDFCKKFSNSLIS